MTPVMYWVLTVPIVPAPFVTVYFASQGDNGFACLAIFIACIARFVAITFSPYDEGYGEYY